VLSNFNFLSDIGGQCLELNNKPYWQTQTSLGRPHFSPFNLDLFFDGLRHLTPSELSAKFANRDSASSGFKKMREKICPSLFNLYSIFEWNSSAEVE
jgi:hypothetical protein